MADRMTMDEWFHGVKKFHQIAEQTSERIARESQNIEAEGVVLEGNLCLIMNNDRMVTDIYIDEDEYLEMDPDTLANALIEAYSLAEKDLAVQRRDAAFSSLGVEK